MTMEMPEGWKTLRHYIPDNYYLGLDRDLQDVDLMRSELRDVLDLMKEMAEVIYDTSGVLANMDRSATEELDALLKLDRMILKFGEWK